MSNLTRESLEDAAYTAVEHEYTAKETDATPDVMRQVERVIYMQSIDQHWKDHLQQMDHLKEGIHLRGYAQKDPKQEYKKEAYNMFVDMMARMQADVLEKIFHVTVTREGEEEMQRRMEEARARQRVTEQHAEATGITEPPKPQPAQAQPMAQQQMPQGPPQKVETYKRDKPKIGRNDQCYCGSGKKYKNCHLTADEEAERAARA